MDYIYKDIRYVKDNFYYPYLAPAKVTIRENFPIEFEPAVEDFILKYKNYSQTNNTLLYNTDSRENIGSIKGKVNNIINVCRVNDYGYINKFFECVNKKLSDNGVFIGCVETSTQKREKIFNKLPAPAAYPFYLLHFIIKRLFPKLFITKKLYYTFSKGKGRTISLTETLGRLISCGFDILGYKEINGLTYFAAKRVSLPGYEECKTYGFLIKLRRVGENGNIINVYKFRTMHPYSEFLQEYIAKKNQLKSTGKFKQDFRITAWGKFLRKLRIDELPMLINFIKGEVKLVGVRPLSIHYHSLYEEDIRKRRVNYKPGLFPPFFADLPKTFSEIMDSERRYLDNYDKKPFITDLKYFLKIMYNINFRFVLGE